MRAVAARLIIVLTLVALLIVSPPDPALASSRESLGAWLDEDRDGTADEDGPDDLDGDGSITDMRKKVATGGTHRLDPDDPRRLIRVRPGETGDYLDLGWEGIDNDGDGRTDHPDDFGCVFPDDPREFPNPACSDGFDNDNDTFIDYPDDMDCTSEADGREDI